MTTKNLRMDSQVKYGLLARGDAARVFMRFPSASYREKIWDHAAGLVVVEEAGGKVGGGAREEGGEGMALSLVNDGFEPAARGRRGAHSHSPILTLIRLRR